MVKKAIIAAVVTVGVVVLGATAAGAQQGVVEQNGSVDVAAVLALIAALPFLGTIASKGYEVIKRITDKDWKGVAGVVATNAIGVGVLWLTAQSDLAESVGAGAFNLATANFATIVLLGLASGSTASVGYDLKRALDNRDTAAQPMLGGGMPPLVASGEVVEPPA